MRWVLHLGTQKTGSKAVQTALAASHDAGELLFPTAGRADIWHQPLFQEIERGSWRALAAAVEEARASRCETAVLSYERFFTLDVGAISRLSEVLGDSLTAVLFLRRQDELVDSRWNQLIKAHRVSADDIDAHERALTDRDPMWDHEATLDRWCTVLPPTRVVPLVYAASEDSPRRFAEAAGLPRPPTQDDDRLAANRALDPYALAVLREVKRRVADAADLVRVVDAAHEVLADHVVDGRGPAGRPWYLSDDQRTSITDAYAASNERVRQRWFPGRPTLFDDARPGACERYELQAADETVIERILRAS